MTIKGANHTQQRLQLVSPRSCSYFRTGPLFVSSIPIPLVVKTSGQTCSWKNHLPSPKYVCAEHRRNNVRIDRSRKRGKVLVMSTGSISKEEKTLLSLCDELVNRCGPFLHKFASQEPTLFERALAEVPSVEGLMVTGFQEPTKRLRSLIVGEWGLVLTNSNAIMRNKGSVTGLPVPAARCVGVEVALENDGSARTIDKLQFAGGALKFTNMLIGKWSLGGKNGRALEVTYEQALLLGGPKFYARSKAVLVTTFVGSSIRIGRSSNDIFVFKRL